MNKIVVISIIIVVATAGTLIAIRQGENAAQERLGQLKIAENANRLALEAQKAIIDAKRVEEIARREAEALNAQIAGYVLEAKSLLDLGQFQQAIDAAKNVLSQDAANAEAKVILKTAMVKLQEIAQQQINALTKQKPQKMVEDSDLAPSIPKQ